MITPDNLSGVPPGPIFPLVTTAPSLASLDRVAAGRWPARAAAHLLGLGLVVAVLIALPTAPSDLDRHQFPKETVIHLAVFLAVLLSRPWPPRGTSRAVRMAAVGLVGWTVASALFATNPWLALRATTLTITALVALITARHVAAVGATPILLGWIVVAVGAGAASGLAQAWGMEHPFFAELRAPGGTFGNRNFLAHLAAAGLPLLVMLVLAARRRLVAITAAIPVAASAAALVLTRSRAGWLAAGGGLGVLALALLLARRRAGVPVTARRVGWVAGLLLAGVVVALAVPNSLEWRSDSPYTDTLGNLTNYREGSGRGRLLQYQHSLELALRHPVLGVAPGNWPLHYGDVAPRSDPSFASNDVVPLNPWPSSDWVALLTERGIPAVVLALLLGVAIAWRGWRGVLAGGERATAGAALMGTVAALGIAGLFDAVLLLAVPALFGALAVGALMQHADGSPTETAAAPLAARPMPASAESLRPPSRWATVLALLVGVGLLRSAMQTGAYLVAGDGSSRARLERAALIDPWSYPIRIALARRGPCRESRDDARMALRLAPTWPAAKRAAARCGI